MNPQAASVRSFSHRATVLVVDHDAVTLARMQSLLQEEPYSLLTATGESDALDAVEGEAVDLVLSRAGAVSDTVFPRFFEKRPDCLQIMLVDDSDTGTAIEAFTDGRIHRYISTPWNDDEARLIIRQALAYQHAERERDRLGELAHRQESEPQRSIGQPTGALSRRILEQSKDLICLFDSAGCLIQINPACREIVGYDPEDVIGKPFGKYLVPEDYAKTRAALLSIIQSGTPLIDLRVRYRCKDGGIVHIMWSAAWLNPERELLCIGRDITALVHAEKQLTENEQRYRSLFEFNPDSVYSLDLEGRVQSINPAGLALLGYAESELLGRHFSALLPAEAFSNVSSHFTSALEGRPQHYEAQCQDKNGNAIDLDVTNLPIVIAGQTVGIFGIAKDITERKRLSQAAYERDQFFTLYLDMFCTVTFKGRFIQANPSFTKVLGFTQDDLLHLSYMDLVVAEDQVKFQQAIEQLRGGQEILNLEVQALDKHGVLHWLELSATSGGADVIYCAARDITERKQTHDRLREQKAMLAIAGSMARMGAWTVELPERHVTWSDELSAIHELRAGSSPSIDEAFELFAPESRDRAVALFESCATQGVPYDEELQILTGKGRRLWARIIGQAVRDPSGAVVRIQGALQDITPEKLASEKSRALAERLTATLESITDAFFTLDHNWRFTYLNTEAERLLRRGRDSLLGKNVWAEFKAAVGSTFDLKYRQAVAENRSVEFEEYYIPLERWLSVSAYPSREGLTVYFRDVTHIKRSEETLRLMQRSLEATYNGIVITDAQAPDMPITYVNPAFERITGYAADEVIGKNCRFLQRSERNRPGIPKLQASLAAKREVNVVLRNYRKDGTPFWNDLFIAPVPDENGRVTHFVGVQNDISQQKNTESALAYNTHHDVLTGLPNRALLEDRLKQSYQMARRSGLGLAVILFNLDGFKPINESLGLNVGDQVLVEVGERLVRSIRPGDTVARLSADEFVAILPNFERSEDVLLIVEHSLAAIALPYHIEERKLRVTASAGIALNDSTVDEPLELIRRADLAMGQAKRQGHNTYHWFTADLGHSIDRVSVRNEIQRALESEAFELHYQPLVDAGTGAVLGMEALLRWNHAERGYISPAEFIPIAEDTGQIIPLSQWVLEKACRENRLLYERGFTEHVVAVNVSPVQFQPGNLVKIVREILERTRLPPHLLELEIVESMLLHDAALAIQTLHELRALGVGISVDDFGTGFSSLSYLKLLPITKVKIDRSFIREVTDDSSDAAITQGIISMAHHLKLRVVAEGVETEQQAEFLRDHSCDILQGYLFAKPMPMVQLEQYLGRTKER